jgi:hypothetical protein
VTDVSLPPVVWLDPGKKTGVAFLRDGVFQSMERDFVETGRLLEHWLSLYGSHLCVGWEDYNATGGGEASYSLEVIGVARWLCRMHDATVLPTVPASSRVVATDQVLKLLTWHRPGLGHANDAARHLVAWLLRTGHMRDQLTEVFTCVLGGGTVDT